MLFQFTNTLAKGADLEYITARRWAEKKNGNRGFDTLFASHSLPLLSSLTSSLHWGPDWSPLSQKHATWRVIERAPSENNMKVRFFPVLPDIRKNNVLHEDCQLSPACPSDKGMK
jgi:hypothetical protein